jgi:hypothetical protein
LNLTGIAAVLCLAAAGQVAAMTLNLTGVTVYDINSAGQYIGNGFDTTGNNGVYNLYLLSSGGAFINSGNGAAASINVNLANPGEYTFGIRADGGGFNWPTPYAGLNLFFNQGAGPGISAQAAYNAASPTLTAFGNGSLGLSNANVVPGANVLSFTSSNLRVRVTNFSLIDYRNANGNDLVGPLNSAPSGLNDYAGQFTLQVTAVPEPSEWAMLLGGLTLVAAVAMRRKRGASV